VSLRDARAKAQEARSAIARGVDPIGARKAAQRAARAARQGRTFGEVAVEAIEARAPEWRSSKHAAQWRATLERDGAAIWSTPIERVDREAVLAVLRPIWTEKPETASRLRQRIEAVLDFARVHELRAGDNPARWRGNLDAILPKPSKVRRVEHHAALPWREVPALMVKVRASASQSARLLELVALTAVRVSEAAAATWVEIDLDAATWTIPPERMKSARPHVVPLAPAALALLKALRAETRSDFVFPRPRGRAHLVPDAARVFLQRELGFEGATVHGLRSSFRDWCADATDYPREVAEASLAHVLPDKTEAAYRRSTMLDKRRALMADWAAFLGTGAAS
jgi:integrase